MPIDLGLTLSEDRETLSLKAAEATLDAAGLEELLELLIQYRTEMLPRRPSIDPFPGTRVLTSPLARWYMDGGADEAVLLGIMHPGLGWVGIPLNVEGAAALAAQAVRAAAKTMLLTAQQQPRPPQTGNSPPSE